MRTLMESLFWRIPSRYNRGWSNYGWRGRPPRHVRYRSPIGRLFGLIWSALWVAMGFAIAFSPEFRSMFIQFWVEFARLMAEFARDLAAAMRPI